MKEFENLILANGIKLDANGYLTKESLKIAYHVAIPHEALNTIEDEKEIQAQLQTSNAMFSYAEPQECNCIGCRKVWTETRKDATSLSQ